MDAQLRNATTDRSNIAHESEFKSFDPGRDDSAQAFIFKVFDPVSELRENPDQDYKCIRSITGASNGPHFVRCMLLFP